MYAWGGSLNQKLHKRVSIRDELVQSVVRPLKDRIVKMVSCGDFHTLALEANG